MKKILTLIGTAILSLFLTVTPVFADNACSDYAEKKGDGVSCVPTSSLMGEKTTSKSGETIYCACDSGNGSSITDILKLIVDIMTIGIGILGVIGIVWSGIQYMTAAGDPGKVQKSKTRILEIVIGLAIYVTIYAILRFLLPNFTSI